MKKFLIIISAFLIASCDKGSTDVPENGNKTEVVKLEKREGIVLSKSQEKVLSTIGDFSIDLFHHVAKTSGNVVMSPLSASVALSMALNGADGETYTQMTDVLGFEESTLDDVNSFFSTLIPALEIADVNSTLYSANSIWVKEDYYLLDSYCNDVSSHYLAEARNLKFDEAAKDVINKWCSDNTNRMIPSFLTGQPEGAALILNALYSKLLWTVPFEKSATKNDGFHNSDATISEVPFMNSSNTYRTYADASVEVMEIPYGNQAYNMVIVIPSEDKDISDAISELDWATWNKWISSLSYDKGIVSASFPKWEADYRTSLKQSLIEMGMDKAFSIFADFTKMVKGSTLMIDDVIQESVIKVDESGAEGCSITEVIMADTTAGPGSEENKPYAFIADRPFIYAISEFSTGTILYLGVIRQL